MHLSKKLIIISTAILLIAIGAGAVYAGVYYQQHSIQKAVQAGLAAEQRGKTEEALSNYKRAIELCAPKDEQCRIDMKMKVQLMEDALKNERKAVPGAAVPGAKIDPSEVVPAGAND